MFIIPQYQTECSPHIKTQDEIEKEKQQEELLRKISCIFISTCNPTWNFDVVDTVFAIDSHEQGFLSHLVEANMGQRLFGGANPGTAFEGVKNQLRLQCLALGGDAVICCQFEHRVASTSGMFGSKQAIEIFAYGTIVKRIPNDA